MNPSLQVLAHDSVSHVVESDAGLFLIAILILASAVRLLRETTAILHQFTPRGLDLEAVTAAMRAHIS